MKAVGYVRVSSMEQVLDGVSLLAQRNMIHAWAIAHEIELVQIYSDEGISGVKSDRPELQKALKYVIKNGFALVIYSLSRLSRSTHDTLEIAENLDKAGADLVSLSERIDTTTASGKMIFRMLAVLNEFERDQISDRTKAALAYKKLNNEKTGGICPYGYTDKEGMLIKNDKEQSVISRILFLTENGESYSSIARKLNQSNCKTKTGKKWYAQTVKNVILYKYNNKMPNREPTLSTSVGVG